MRFRSAASLSALAALFLTPPAGAQHFAYAERPWSRASSPRDASAPVPSAAPPPTRQALYRQTMGWGSAAAVAYGSLGMAIDVAVCERRHGDQGGPFAGPCALPLETGTRIGWFGGAVLGATLAASGAAHARGCPPSAAWWRAFGGALLGAAPGAVVAATRPEPYSPQATALAIGAPLLSGLGAATAVVGCRGPRRAVAAGARRHR